MGRANIDNPTFLYLDHKFEQMQERQAKIDRQHKEDQDKVNEKLFGDLKEIKENVYEVDKKVAYTNGTVRKHTDEIKALKTEVKHEDCPGKQAMIFVNDFESQEKVKKGPMYKSGVALALLMAAYGLFQGIKEGLTFIFE